MDYGINSINMLQPMIIALERLWHSSGATKKCIMMIFVFNDDGIESITIADDYYRN